MGAEKGRIINAAQLIRLAISPMVVKSIPASRQPALVAELVMEWVIQMTVYAINSMIKFLLAIWKNVFFCVAVLLILIFLPFYLN